MARNSRARHYAARRREAAAAMARDTSAVPGLSIPVAQREQPDVLAGDFRLTEHARLRHPAVRWWWGARLLDGQHGAYCYLCELLIVTWQRSYPMTDQARRAVLEHRDQVHSLAAPPTGPNAQPTQGGPDREQES